MVAKVYVKRGRCLTAENNFLSAERQISTKAGRSGGTKRLRWLRLINASSRWWSAALVNPQSPTRRWMQHLKVIEAYAGNLSDVSLHGHLTVQQDAKISYNISTVNNR